MYPNLLVVMKRKKITFSQIAELLHCQLATVSDKAQGKYANGFYFDEAERIKNVFFKEFDIEWLFRRED